MAKINQFGYREELNRSMGAFSSFAISFSLISVLTGIFANFYFGYKQAGGMILWTWLLVACGQFVVALVMANLSIRFPIAGYGYQWAARLVNTHYGFFVGWMLLVQFITGFPGICQTFTITLFGLIGAPNNYEWVTIGTVLVISVVTFIHLLGINYASKVNDLGVYAELIGVLFLIIVLSAVWLFSDPHPLGAISKGVNPMQLFKLPFSSLALSLLLGAWCLTGFEAAADLAEETQSPLRNVPRAVIFSLVISAICGGLIILLFIVQASNFSNIDGDGNVLLLVLENTIGHRLTLLLTLFILFSIFACAVAALATVSRLLFSLSRDQVLPLSAWISKVDTHTQTPKNALFLIWGLSICVIVFFKRLEIITNISALAAYVGYAGIMLGCLVGERQPQTSGFHASKGQRAIQWVAFLWTLLVIAALSIPETRIEGFQMLHIPALSTAIAGFIGVLLYMVYVRKQIQLGQAGPPKIN